VLTQVWLWCVCRGTARSVDPILRQVLESATPSIIPCSVLQYALLPMSLTLALNHTHTHTHTHTHICACSPQHRFCSVQAVATWINSFRRVLPTYLTLTIVPTIAFHIRKFIRRWAKAALFT
jgi:hypothetical protein